MKTAVLILLAVASGLSVTASAKAPPHKNTSQFNPGTMAESAPPELAHWGKMVGRWSTVEESLKPDGSGWVPSNGADWDFFWAFDGWGIQDNYTSPPIKEPVENEQTRQRGTNLRIYNPAEKKWILTWLTTTSTQPQTFTAVSNDKEIVMLSDAVNPQGFHGRVTFFDITETTFEWKLEWSKDKEQWREVYRIHGTRKAD